MNNRKVILIGCDSPQNLSVIMNSMMTSEGFCHHVISATRISDLMNIFNSTGPDLVICCFRNNQLAINDVNSFSRNPSVPLLCIAGAEERQSISWNSRNIVFTCFMEHISNSDYFVSTINSIFLLKQPTPEKNGITTAHPPIETSASLSRYVMELDQKTKVLSKVKERIAGLYPKVDDPTRSVLNSIVNGIRLSANDHQLWEDFKMYFEMSDPGFLLMLAKKHPDLTSIDIKYCCYLKMNMSNDDIRNLLGINQESVRTHKYRLKKKMLLDKDQDLGTYLRAVG